jgi:Domain of unknown function (DUF4340)
VRPRTLEILALLVVALAVVVLVDQPPAAVAPLPDRLFPGLVAARVARLHLLGAGRPEMVVARVDEGWTLDPGALPADDDAVADLTGTIEYLAYRRRVAHAAGGSRGLDAPRLTLEIGDSDGGVHLLHVGAPEPLLGRTWITLGGNDDFLVDDYAIRALDRRPDDLRRRTPLAGAASADAIGIAAGGHEVVLSGRPACVALAGGCAAADRTRVTALRNRLTDLAMSQFLARAPEGPAALRVTAGDTRLEATDAACPDAPDERQVRSPLGAGCIAASTLADLVRDAATPEAWVETSPLTLPAPDVDRITLGALVLERVGGGWTRVGQGAVDAEAVRSWLDALASFRGRVAVTAPLAAVPAGATKIGLAAGDRTETLLLLAGSGPAVLRRDAEPVALTVHPGVRSVVHADATTFADRSVLELEPTALAEIRVETWSRAGPPIVETAIRGTTLEHFTLATPVPLPVDDARLDKLRDTASHLRAARVAAFTRAALHGLTAPRRRITFIVDAPIGEAGVREHVLELGATTPDGSCYAARGGDATVFLLAAAACDTFAAALASRHVYDLAPDEAVAVSAFGDSAERHGGAWYRADGTRLDPPASARLASAIKLLAVAPDVAGYGTIAGGAPLVFTGPKGPISLHAGRGEYVLDGRPVRYRIPDELCQRFPSVCTTR